MLKHSFPLQNYLFQFNAYRDKIVMIKFSYKIDCSLGLQTHSISFYWR